MNIKTKLLPGENGTKGLLKEYGEQRAPLTADVMCQVAMKIIYANLIWFIFVIAGLIGRFYERHTSLGWDNMPEVQIEYDLIFGLLTLYLIVASIGLIQRKRWGYFLSLAANHILAVTPLLIFTVVLIMLNELSVLDQVKASTGNFLVSLVSIAFIYLMRKEQVKCLF